MKKLLASYWLMPLLLLGGGFLAMLVLGRNCDQGLACAGYVLLLFLGGTLGLGWIPGVYVYRRSGRPLAALLAGVATAAAALWLTIRWVSG